eukprot:CAMPEP_0178986882 /NCGR_PEP_ID=MMETSP0795-20121207/2951_1 /TAXON_ID=88552 /ORGANISM="Amoebophrya sp., Strain Ameob2" /LENGTH=1301 /DNA_ID=CAMNT_0020677993 /DNA_START=105 /DNA_END=4010 /DNA_ORIENTATION=-
MRIAKRGEASRYAAPHAGRQEVAECDANPFSADRRDVLRAKEQQVLRQEAELRSLMQTYLRGMELPKSEAFDQDESFEQHWRDADREDRKQRQMFDFHKDLVHVLASHRDLLRSPPGPAGKSSSQRNRSRSATAFSEVEESSDQLKEIVQQNSAREGAKRGAGVRTTTGNTSSSGPLWDVSKRRVRAACRALVKDATTTSSNAAEQEDGAADQLEDLNLSDCCDQLLQAPFDALCDQDADDGAAKIHRQSSGTIQLMPADTDLLSLLEQFPETLGALEEQEPQLVESLRTDREKVYKLQEVPARSPDESRGSNYLASAEPNSTREQSRSMTRRSCCADEPSDGGGTKAQKVATPLQCSTTLKDCSVLRGGGGRGGAGRDSGSCESYGSIQYGTAEDRETLLTAEAASPHVLQAGPGGKTGPSREKRLPAVDEEEIAEQAAGGSSIQFEGLEVVNDVSLHSKERRQRSRAHSASGGQVETHRQGDSIAPDERKNEMSRSEFLDACEIPDSSQVVGELDETDMSLLARASLTDVLTHLQREPRRFDSANGSRAGDSTIREQQEFLDVASTSQLLETRAAEQEKTDQVRQKLLELTSKLRALGRPDAVAESSNARKQSQEKAASVSSSILSKKSHNSVGFLEEDSASYIGGVSSNSSMRLVDDDSASFAAAVVGAQPPRVVERSRGILGSPPKKKQTQLVPVQAGSGDMVLGGSSCSGRYDFAPTERPAAHDAFNLDHKEAPRPKHVLPPGTKLKQTEMTTGEESSTAAARGQADRSVKVVVAAQVQGFGVAATQTRRPLLRSSVKECRRGMRKIRTPRGAVISVTDEQDEQPDAPAGRKKKEMRSSSAREDSDRVSGRSMKNAPIAFKSSRQKRDRAAAAAYQEHSVRRTSSKDSVHLPGGNSSKPQRPPSSARLYGTQSGPRARSSAFPSGTKSRVLTSSRSAVALGGSSSSSVSSSQRPSKRAATSTSSKKPTPASATPQQALPSHSPETIVKKRAETSSTTDAAKSSNASKVSATTSKSSIDFCEMNSGVEAACAGEAGGSGGGGTKTNVATNTVKRAPFRVMPRSAPAPKPVIKVIVVPRQEHPPRTRNIRSNANAQPKSSGAEDSVRTPGAAPRTDPAADRSVKTSGAKINPASAAPVQRQHGSSSSSGDPHSAPSASTAVPAAKSTATTAPYLGSSPPPRKRPNTLQHAPGRRSGEGNVREAAVVQIEVEPAVPRADTEPCSEVINITKSRENEEGVEVDADAGATPTAGSPCDGRANRANTSAQMSLSRIIAEQLDFSISQGKSLDGAAQVPNKLS